MPTSAAPSARKENARKAPRSSAMSDRNTLATTSAIPARAQPKQYRRQDEPQQCLRGIKRKVLQRGVDPSIKEVPELQCQQQRREQDGAGFEHLDQQVVGAAAELPGRDDEGEGRDAIAVE